MIWQHRHYRREAETLLPAWIASVEIGRNSLSCMFDSNFRA